jgi:aminoglycoside phosphotransferase (APT) family kinase protein
MIVRYLGDPLVGANLLNYLAARVGAKDLDFAERPSQIIDGWETFIYHFRLKKSDRLPALYRRPLILRIYSSIYGLPRLRQEVAAQRFMRVLGYPVPRPLLMEEDCDYFGGPFAVVECVPGRTLLDLISSQPWRLISGPAQLARAQARLHQHSPEGFPASPRPFLSRKLEGLEETIAAYDLDGLKPGYEWLCRGRPTEPTRPCILHLDFHPMNSLFHRGRCSGVIDWCESDVGDRHADVATTLMLMKTAPVTIPLWQRPFTAPSRWLIRTRYLHVYERLLPLDRPKLSYYVALAALRRLCRWGVWYKATPRITGSKPSVVNYLAPERVGRVVQCFREETGVAVHL